jgi:hypothetical protein
LKVLSEVFCHFFNKFDGVAVFFSFNVHSVVDTNSEILCHEPFLHCFDDGSFEGFGEMVQFSVSVKLGSMKEASCPGEDAGN